MLYFCLSMEATHHAPRRGLFRHPSLPFFHPSSDKTSWTHESTPGWLLQSRMWGPRLLSFPSSPISPIFYLGHEGILFGGFSCHALRVFIGRTSGRVLRTDDTGVTFGPKSVSKSLCPFQSPPIRPYTVFTK